MFRQSTNQNHSQVFGSWVTSLDSINSWSIQMLLRGENDSKQSDEFQATTGSPMKWCMSNQHRIWVLLLLFGANFPQYDQSASATLIWVVTCYQYGISLPVSQTWFCRETSCGVAKCQLFTQASAIQGLSCEVGSNGFNTLMLYHLTVKFLLTNSG